MRLPSRSLARAELTGLFLSGMPTSTDLRRFPGSPVAAAGWTLCSTPRRRRSATRGTTRQPCAPLLTGRAPQLDRFISSSRIRKRWHKRCASGTATSSSGRGRRWPRRRGEDRCEQLVNRLVDSTVAFIERHPAFLALLDAPVAMPVAPKVRERSQRLVATILLARRPRMALEKARRLATVTLQTVKGMNFLYRDLAPRARRRYVLEFKILLLRYLECRMNHRTD